MVPRFHDILSPALKLHSLHYKGIISRSMEYKGDGIDPARLALQTVLK